MTDSAQEEKRAFLRVPFTTEVLIKTAAGVIRSTTEIDIGLKGLRIPVEQTPPPAGTPCEVKITLHASEPAVVIEAAGAVVRSGPESLAVEFEELDLDSYHHLRQLITSNAADPEQADREFAAHWGLRRPRPKQ
jgi:hypothetical protein